MNPFADQTSAEVAEEAESERAGLVNTLDQLRENLRPGNMVDEMFTQAQAGSSDLVDRIWRVARANPIPAALIGLGAAMLVSAGQRFRRTSTERDAYWISHPKHAARHGTSADAFDPSSRLSAELEELGSYAIVPHTSDRSPTGLSRIFEEQPLILAALGVAVGAAVGSAIPSTDVESQWLGDASESVRRNAGAMARDQLSQLRSTASQTLDQMKATAAEHGVSSENVSGLVRDLGEDVKTAAFSTGQSRESPAAQ